MKTPDVNVLIYAVNIDAPQHARARRWIEDAYSNAAGIGFAWVALLGFLRLATRPGILQHPLPIEHALAVLDDWLAHPRARILHADPQHAAILARLLLGEGRGGNLVTDAHLAAIAIAHGATLGTFDRDFERFAGLRVEFMGTPMLHEP